VHPSPAVARARAPLEAAVNARDDGLEQRGKRGRWSKMMRKVRDRPSGYIEALLEALKRVGGLRIVVVFQYTTMIEVVRDLLEDMGCYEVEEYTGRNKDTRAGGLDKTKRKSLWEMTLAQKFKGTPAGQVAARRVCSYLEKTRVLLLQIKCGGIGLDLSRFDSLVLAHAEMDPSVELQAFRRIWRLGQYARVRIARVEAAGSVSAAIRSTLHDGKMRLSVAAYSGGDDMVKWRELSRIVESTDEI
jgi:SNF2 family DNA or RNA helicase